MTKSDLSVPLIELGGERMPLDFRRLVDREAPFKQSHGRVGIRRVMGEGGRALRLAAWYHGAIAMSTWKVVLALAAMYVLGSSSVLTRSLPVLLVVISIPKGHSEGEAHGYAIFCFLQVLDTLCRIRFSLLGDI